jgi:DNA helicase-2/ATP-dependent DNA helicase PcrA
MLHGQVSYGMASGFLRELPDHLLHWITPRVAARNRISAIGNSMALTPNPSPAGGRGERVSAGEGLWRVGQAVSHSKFGSGVIVNLEGSGADARVQVNFRKAGTKWLALEYAKLTTV